MWEVLNQIDQHRPTATQLGLEAVSVTQRGGERSGPPATSPRAEPAAETELVQFTFLVVLDGVSLEIGSEFLPIAIEDRTRLAYAALLPDETAASATAFLALAHRGFAARGVRIHGRLTDNGSGYRGRVFGALCGQLGLRHHGTRPYRPQTDGKAERFIRPCLSEWAYVRSDPTSVTRASALPALLRYDH